MLVIMRYSARWAAPAPRHAPAWSLNQGSLVPRPGMQSYGYAPGIGRIYRAWLRISIHPRWCRPIRSFLPLVVHALMTAPFPWDSDPDNPFDDRVYWRGRYIVTKRDPYRDQRLLRTFGGTWGADGRFASLTLYWSRDYRYRSCRRVMFRQEVADGSNRSSD